MKCTCPTASDEYYTGHDYSCGLMEGVTPLHPTRVEPLPNGGVIRYYGEVPKETGPE